MAVAGPVLHQSPRLGRAQTSERSPTPAGRDICLRSPAARPSQKRSRTCWWSAAIVWSPAAWRKIQGAKFSEHGFSKLVERAAADDVLAEKVGLRPDVPAPLFRTLLLQATEVVRQRLLAQARPGTAAEIRRVLAEVCERDRRQGSAAARLRSGQGDGPDAEGAGNARRAGAPRICRGGKIRGDRRCHRGAERSADRDRGATDGERTAGPRAHPVQSRRIRMADRAGA